MSQKPLIPLAFYVFLFAAALGTISYTLYNYPLFPFQTDDLDWSVAWLMTTIIDFYGSTLCLAGIVLASESSWLSGILWTAGFCLLGSPVCCVWVILRLARQGSLRIETPRPDPVTGTESQRLEGHLS